MANWMQNVMDDWKFYRVIIEKAADAVGHVRENDRLTFEYELRQALPVIIEEALSHKAYYAQVVGRG